jgi:hypothetical protein
MENMMISERYRRFLKREAERNPLKIERFTEKEHLRVSWENPPERPVRISLSDIIDSVYLGKDMGETVVVDRRVAVMLEDRLKRLEKENFLMRKRIKIFKIVIMVLILIVPLMLYALITKIILP